MKRLGIVLAGLILLSVSAASIYAQTVGHSAVGVTLTGCLSRSGELHDVSVGDNPRKSCERHETMVQLGNGDITGVTGGTGLEGGGSSGDVALDVVPSFRLPQGCTAGQLPKLTAAAGWSCGDDQQTNVSVQPLAVGDSHCPNGGVSITIGTQTSYVCNGANGANGAQGPPGGAAQMSSSNGEYSIELTNDGIYLRGPAGTFVVGPDGVTQSSDSFYGR